MKRFFLSLALLAAVAGCNSSTGGDDNSAAVDAANRYLPLATGATWTYTVTGLDLSTSTETERILGTTIRLFKTYWAIERTSSSVTDTTLVRIGGATLYQQPSQLSYFTKPALPAKAALSLTGDLPYFEFGLATGSTWSMFTATSEGRGYTITGKYDGTESVIVPAGVYMDCAKFEYIETVTTGGSITGSYIETTWLAPNVGPVKRTTEIEGITTSISVLTSHTTL